MRLSVILMLLLAGCPAAQAQSFETYNAPDLGFRIQYPSGWEMHEAANTAAVYWFYPGKDLRERAVENVQLTATKFSGSGGFDMAAYMARSRVESQFPGLELASSREVSMGDVKLAHRFEYAGQHQGRSFQLLQVLCQDGDRGFTLQFGATPENYKTHIRSVEKMLGSFKAR